MRFSKYLFGIFFLAVLFASCEEKPINITINSPDENPKKFGDTLTINLSLTKEEDLINNVSVLITPTNNKLDTIFSRGRLVNEFATAEIAWEFIINGYAGQEWTLEAKAWNNGFINEPTIETRKFQVNP